ncbi:hypothetical protein UFOVP239_65 [uncultured Caudovirales phage]|uniref:Uncharacterized protein n=1 Tax=uncultured Caudovirales phage TaxID=2100421 RepID=A0A6J7WTW7_9CAUD|nr:hypothetical protein UFOVP239_65 [uncultured Caudovirales phage]
MPQITITELPQALALSGTESVPIVQNGVTVQTTTGAMAGAGALNYPFVTIGSTIGLTQARALAAGSGLSLADGGAGGSLQINMTGAALSLNSSGTGLQVKSGSTMSAVSLEVGSGLGVTNANGTTGNPKISLGTFLSNFASQTGTGMLAIQSGSVGKVNILGNTNQISIANGNGAGDITISLADNAVMPGNGSMTVPLGTTLQRSGSPTNGMIRYNTDLGTYEGYQAGSWRVLSFAGGVTQVNTGTGLLGGPIVGVGTINIDNTVVATLTDAQTLTNKILTTPAINGGGTTLSNGGTVTGITRLATNSNYTSAPSMVIASPTTAGGVQATASCTIGMTLFPINGGGTGYTAGDVLTIVGGTFTTVATLTVSTVSGGVITAVTGTNAGVYTIAPTNPVSVTGGTGNGATFNLGFAINGSFTITNAGSGYIETPAVTFSGGGGTGASATAYVGSLPVIKTAYSALALQTPNANLSVQIQDDQSLINSTPSILYINSASSVGGKISIRSSKALYLSSQSSNSIYFTTQSSATSDGTNQFVISNTTAAVNWLQATGAVTASAPNISAQGSDANINFTLSAKGTGAVQSSSALRAGTSGANYHQWAGAATTQAPGYSVQGTDTNIDLTIASKGTGALKFLTNGTVQQVAIADTASAVNYVQMTGAATGGLPALSVQGSDASISMSYIAKGSGGYHFFYGNNTSQFGIAPVASSVNRLEASGAVTTASPKLSAAGSDTNIDVSLVTKGTGAIKFLTNGSVQQVAITDTASAVNYIQITGSATTIVPQISSQGSDANIGLLFQSKSASILFATRSSNARSFNILDSVSPVNYLQVQGNTAGNPPVFSSQGTDATIGMLYQCKGGQDHRFYSNSGNAEQFRVIHTAGTITNYVTATGAITATAPIVAAAGSDTNIDLSLTPKGTGYVKVSSGTGLGYGTGTGGAVTQLTSRTTGVTLNFPTGAITLFSAAGTSTWQTFTVTNSAVVATDTIIVNQKSGTDLYQIFVTNVAAGSFKISFATTGGITTEQPVFNFAVLKGVAA